MREEFLHPDRNPTTCEPCGRAIETRKGRNCYVPCGHTRYDRSRGLEDYVGPAVATGAAVGSRFLPQSSAGTKGAATEKAVAQTAGGAIFGFAPALVAAGPVGWAVLGVAAGLEVFGAIFHGGCGAACTDAAKSEQIYEAAALNLLAVARAGMISGPEAAAGIRAASSVGQQHTASFGTKQAAAGAAHLAKLLEGNFSDASALPAARTKPLDVAAARALYIQPGTRGWYSDSLKVAAQAADSYLQSLPATTAAETVQALGQSLSQLGIPMPLLVAAGILAGLWALKEL